MLKHLTLAATLVAAAAAPAWAQPAGAGEDYFSPGYRGGGPLVPTPLVPSYQPVDPSTLPRWQDIPRPAYHYPPPPPDPELQRRIEALQQQNQLLGQEWTQQLLRDALRR